MPHIGRQQPSQGVIPTPRALTNGAGSSKWFLGRARLEPCRHPLKEMWALAPEGLFSSLLELRRVIGGAGRSATRVTPTSQRARRGHAMASLLELVRRTLTPASLRNVLNGTDLQLWLLSAGLSRVGLSRRAARRCGFRTYRTGHLDLVANMLGQLRRISGQL